MAKRKSQFVFNQETYRSDSGYWHTRVGVYDTPELTPIDEAIARCDVPGVYSNPDAALRNKRRYERLRDAGAAAVVNLMFTARVQFSWQHYNTAKYRAEGMPPFDESTRPSYCEANIEISKRRAEVARDYKLWRRLESLMHRRWRALPRGADRDSPELMFETLKRARAFEMVSLEVPDPDFSIWREWVVMRPRSEAKPVEYSLVVTERAS